MKAVTEKHPESPSTTLKTIGVKIPPSLKFGHLYYEVSTYKIYCQYAFSSKRLAQIHGSLEHAPPASVYSALQCIHPVDTTKNNLSELYK